MKYDVFISCKSEDYNIGRQVYEFLTNYRGLNISVFMADRELRKRGNADYGTVIDEALDSSTHLIIVASNADYLKETSTYVYEEWHTFVEEIRSGRKKGNILTIFTDGVDLKDVPIALRNRQSFPFTEYSSIIDYLNVSDDFLSDSTTVNSLPNNLQNDDESEVMDLDYDDALAFFESGEFQDAMHSLQISYESGNNETVNIFNQLLFKNFGNIEWNDETWDFLKKQAEEGKSFANLAFFYKLKGNKETYSEAWKHLKSARQDQKNGYAILCEGIAYAKGIGTVPNLKIATNRFKNALKMGIWDSCSYLAEMYLSGNSGARVDKNEAMGILSEGQKHDDARSWYVLGSIYEEKAYVKENWEKAVDSFKKAVELHMFEAWINLGNLYNYNRFSGDYKDEALSCYLEALKNGNKDAHAYIAMQYWEKGRQEDAILEAQKGEKVGNVLSISTLGKFYEEGLQEEGHWIKEPKPDYPKAWTYYREAFQLGGNVKDAISMARLFVRDEYIPDGISWDTIQCYLEEGSKVPIKEAVELMIEALKKNGKEKEILKYLKIGADSGWLSMKHEYGIRLFSTDNGTALRLIEEAGEKSYQPSVEWLINYYGTSQTYSKKDYEKWMEKGADMGLDVPLDDYIPYLVETKPEKAKDYLLSKYSGNDVKSLIWIYKYHITLGIDKHWLLEEFKSKCDKSQMNLVLLSEHYADFLLNNSFMNEYDEFHEKISSLFQDEGRYYSLLKEVFVTKELKKELAVKINNFSRDESVRTSIRLKSRTLLQKYLSTKKNSKILLVDGQTSNILLLKILFTNEGCNVCTANTGEECIELAHREIPDVILLNILLPDINGFDVTIKLKSDPVTKDIPIIFLTALNTPVDMVRGYQVGAADYLVKPFNKEELLCRITHQFILGKLSKFVLGNPKDTARKKKIMVVDDVMSNVLLVKILLTNEGYDVCTAGSGMECVESAPKEKPDIILLDVMMPDLSGFDATVMLKKDPNTWDIPIMFLTALNNSKDLVHGFKIGASDFLSKPFNKEELIVRVKSVLAVNEVITNFLNS